MRSSVIYKFPVVYKFQFASSFLDRVITLEVTLANLQMSGKHQFSRKNYVYHCLVAVLVSSDLGELHKISWVYH